MPGRFAGDRIALPYVERDIYAETPEGEERLAQREGERRADLQDGDAVFAPGAWPR